MSTTVYNSAYMSVIFFKNKIKCVLISLAQIQHNTSWQETLTSRGGQDCSIVQVFLKEGCTIYSTTLCIADYITKTRLYTALVLIQKVHNWLCNQSCQSDTIRQVSVYKSHHHHSPHISIVDSKGLPPPLFWHFLVSAGRIADRNASFLLNEYASYCNTLT